MGRNANFGDRGQRQFGQRWTDAGSVHRIDDTIRTRAVPIDSIPYDLHGWRAGSSLQIQCDENAFFVTCQSSTLGATKFFERSGAGGRTVKRQDRRHRGHTAEEETRETRQTAPPGGRRRVAQ